MNTPAYVFRWVALHYATAVGLPPGLERPIPRLHRWSAAFLERPDPCDSECICYHGQCDQTFGYGARANLLNCSHGSCICDVGYAGGAVLTCQLNVCVMQSNATHVQWTTTGCFACVMRLHTVSQLS